MKGDHPDDFLEALTSGVETASNAPLVISRHGFRKVRHEGKIYLLAMTADERAQPPEIQPSEIPEFERERKDCGLRSDGWCVRLGGCEACKKVPPGTPGAGWYCVCYEPGNRIRKSSVMKLRYELHIAGFALSDAADSAESAIAWNEVDAGKFLHVYVDANVPEHVDRLEGRYVRIAADGTIDLAKERDLGPSTKVRDGLFRFTLTHYILDNRAQYLIRVADHLAADAKCISAMSIATK